MSEYEANKALKEGAANVRNPRGRRATDARYPVARFIFRTLLLGAWGVIVYNVAVSVLA